MSVVLVVLIILFGILGPTVAGRSFLTITNIFTLINQNAYLMILGVGITFIMLGGGMDLSTGYLISTVGMIMALLDTSANWIVAIICGILLAVLISAAGIPIHHYSWYSVHIKWCNIPSYRRYQQDYLRI